MAHTVALAMGGAKRRPRFTDFLLRWSTRKRQTGAEQLAILRALAARQGKDGHVDDR